MPWIFYMKKLMKILQLNNFELTYLRSELKNCQELYHQQTEIQSWLEEKDEEVGNKICKNKFRSEVSTINSMKYSLIEHKKPKTSEYLDHYKDAIRIYETLKPETFILSVSCDLNEILRQVAYKLWKIMKIANPKFPAEITQIIDNYKFSWMEDFNFYNTKMKEEKFK